MAEQSINVPQVLVFIVVTFLAVRWYFSKPTTAAPGTRAAANRATPRINLAQIDQVAEMLPQLSRRDIAWDLQRNGGNVAATTERALSGRGLDTVGFIHGHVSKRTWFADVETGTTIFPNTCTTRFTCTSSTSRCTSEAFTSRSDHTIQPIFKDQRDTPGCARRAAKIKILECGQEREAGESAKEERGNDFGRTEKVGGTGKGKGFGNKCIEKRGTSVILDLVNLPKASVHSPRLVVIF